MAEHPADQLYDRMVDIFGTGGNEMFVMEWPARPLAASTYAYDVSNVYSGLMKPQPVVEAEFRLSDGLIDIATIVAGSNGQMLSVAAQDALNQLVPAYTEVSKAFQADRQTIREWLLQPIEASWLDEHGKEVTLKAARVEVYDALNDRYEQARVAWDLEKTKRLAEAEVAPDPAIALENYAKWLAEVAPAKEGELEGLFADLVVKGFYHEVRGAIATLDISTPGEALEDAKTRMRASGLSSLDESETIYPVSFQPQDWFTALSTNFAPEDLLLDPMAIQSQLIQTQRQIAQLEEQVTFLQSTHTGDEKALQAEVNQARVALDSALTNLTNQFASNVLTVARMYFGTVTTDPAKATETGLDEALKSSGLEGGLTDAQWQALLSGFTAVGTAQQALTTAGRNLVDLQAALMSAKTTDASQSIASLQTQIGQLQQQAQTLENTLYSSEAQARLQKLAAPGASGAVTYDPAKDPNWTPGSGGKPGSYAMLPTPMPAPGDWFDVVFHFTTETSTQQSAASASASQTSWDVDLFFGSASGSSESSVSDSSASMDVHSLDMQVAFRAMKVSIDRGGWFDPTAFAMTSEMYNLGPKDDAGYPLISYGPPLDAQGAPIDYKSADAPKAFAAARKGILPAYPTGFLIAKDVTIHVAGLDTKTAKSAHADASSSSYSGGLFCFSVSGSSSSSDNSSTAFSSAIDSDLIIKIPGPQILGWFLEYVPKDLSTPYAAMPPGYFPKDSSQPADARLAVAAAAAPESITIASPEAIALEQAGRSEVQAVLLDGHATSSASN